MLGLTVEKLFLVALLAAVIIGPRRLPEYAGRAARLIRRFGSFRTEARRRAEEIGGVVIDKDDWQQLDPRRYDPRRIIADALREPDAAPARTVEEPASEAVVDEPVAAPETPISEPVPTGPAGHWVVTGTSAHPRRMWVADEPATESEILAAAS